MRPCFACDAAKLNPRTGHYNADCQECSARALAQSQAFMDTQKAGVMTKEYRSALQFVFGADWKAHHETVKRYAEAISACRT